MGGRGDAHLGRASVARHLGRDTGERCPSVDRSCTQEVHPALSAGGRPIKCVAQSWQKDRTPDPQREESSGRAPGQETACILSLPGFLGKLASGAGSSGAGAGEGRERSAARERRGAPAHCAALEWRGERRSEERWGAGVIRGGAEPAGAVTRCGRSVGRARGGAACPSSSRWRIGRQNMLRRASPARIRENGGTRSVRVLTLRRQAV